MRFLLLFPKHCEEKPLIWMFACIFEKAFGLGKWLAQNSLKARWLQGFCEFSTKFPQAPAPSSRTHRDLSPNAGFMGMSSKKSNTNKGFRFAQFCVNDAGIGDAASSFPIWPAVFHKVFHRFCGKVPGLRAVCLGLISEVEKMLNQRNLHFWDSLLDLRG